MPRHSQFDDDVPEWHGAYDQEADVDAGDEDDESLVDCRGCGRPIPEDSSRCLYCGRGDALGYGGGTGLGFFRNGAWWVVILVALGIAAVILNLIAGF